MAALETATRYEVEIDTAIANKYDELSSASDLVNRCLDSIHRYAGDRRDTWTKGQPWKMTDEQAVVATPKGFYASQHAAAVGRLPLLRERVNVLNDELEALHAQYTGWSRFFLVISSDGGHIHKDRNCSTCRWTTQYGWLPQLSGLTEADAVADQGPRLCSVCFPLAPVEWTLGTPSTKTYCSGSNKRPEGWTGRQNYMACPDCGKYVAVTKYGEIRKHQPNKA